MFAPHRAVGLGRRPGTGQQPQTPGLADRDRGVMRAIVLPTQGPSPTSLPGFCPGRATTRTARSEERAPPKLEGSPVVRIMKTRDESAETHDITLRVYVTGYHMSASESET